MEGICLKNSGNCIMTENILTK
ncbi:MAG: hypothetical protein JW729_04245 [Bacteroidales bacterium]|nr:hypothetical protein [Bacteroidales bacterium]